MGYEELEESKTRLDDVTLERQRPFETVRAECHYDLEPVSYRVPHVKYSTNRYDLEDKFVTQGATYDIREDWGKTKHVEDYPPVSIEEDFDDPMIPEPSVLTDDFDSYGFRYTANLGLGNSKHAWYSYTDLDIDQFRIIEELRNELIEQIKFIKSIQDAYRECRYRNYITDTLQKIAENNEEDFTPPDFGPPPTFIDLEGETRSITEISEDGCDDTKAICEFLRTEINENLKLECELIRERLGEEYVGTDLDTWWWEGWLDDDLFDKREFMDIDHGQQGVTFSPADFTVKDHYARPPYQDVAGSYVCGAEADVDEETGLVIPPDGGFTSDVCGCVDPDIILKTLPKYVTECNFPNYGEKYPEYLEYVASKDVRFWNTPLNTPLLRKAQETQLRSSEIMITVPGDFGLEVGMIIELKNAPSANIEGITGREPGADAYSILDGKWLIVGIKHTFQKGGRHTNIMTCVRDGLYVQS